MINEHENRNLTSTTSTKKPSVELLVISLCSPLLVGIYENGVLKEQLLSQKHASEALVEILENTQKRYNITSVGYANTPGSFMGLKVAYTILKVYTETLGVEFWAVSGFSLNGGGAIKANNAVSFVKEGDEVVLKRAVPASFALPPTLKSLAKTHETLPDYIISAV